MKKIFYYTLSVAFMATAMASCAKSTKGKMANEWKVTSYQEKSTDVQDNGDKTVSTTTMTENAITMTTEDTPSGGSTTTTTRTGTVSANDLTIKKDGTWTWTQNATIVENFGFTVTTTYNTNKSGTWSFVGKTKGDDFKKNERILFNVLSESGSTVQTSGNTSLTSTSSDTYLTGEYTMLFTVKESKGKSLELESEGANSSTYNNQTSTYNTSTSMKLEEK
jgi:hypothetical protein